MPNANTLMINPGDVVAVSISDPPQGFTTIVSDLTTHRTGFMTASAANGFMNTNIADCSGTPYNFHADDVARYGGTIISAALPNPEFAGHCKI